MASLAPTRRLFSSTSLQPVLLAGSRSPISLRRPCARCRAAGAAGPLWAQHARGLPLVRRAGFAVSSRVQAKRYTPDHEWIELSEDGKTGTIGVSAYAANQLGDVVFVELPQMDLDVNAGDTIGAVESVKSASDILTPVTGKIVAQNEKLEETPSLINKSPEQDGWIARVSVKDPAEYERLLDAKSYRTWVEAGQ